MTKAALIQTIIFFNFYTLYDQPADARIIKCFKGYYRNLTVQKCLYMVD